MVKSGIKSIDDEQAQTPEDHFDAIMADKTFVDSNYSKKTADDLPSWFDEELFKRGQLYFAKNVLSIHAAYLTGIIAALIVPTMEKIIIFTKQSSTPCLAFKRYLQTLLLIIQMHEHDINDSSSKFYKALNTILWKHASVNKRCQASNQSGISQRDMVLTQFVFAGYVLVKSEEFGFTNEIEGRQAFNHFWRVIGYFLGIPNRLNLCRKNEFETTLLCEKIRKEIMSNYLNNPPTDFHFLTETALEGLRSVDPTFHTDVLFKIFYEVHGIKYEKELSTYSTIIYTFRKSVIASFSIPIVGNISRIFWNYYVRVVNCIAENIPFLAYIKYGQKQSKLNLYPHSDI